MKPKIRIGTSGWNYGHWKGLFYDQDCPMARWLEFYAQRFSTLEVNSTFYHLPKPATIGDWHRRTPAGFVWAVKASRYITHIKRLKDPQSLQRFFGIVEGFADKLGPILFQFPPNLKYDEALFCAFLSRLRPQYRYAIEARNADWLKKEALDRMEDFRIAFCISDTAGRFPYAEAITADFTYLRLHGSRSLYASDYSDEELQAWAAKIRKWKRDTYVYFDNDYAGYAPKNAARLKEILGAL